MPHFGSYEIHWSDEIHGSNGLYIQYTAHNPTEKPLSLTHPLRLYSQRNQTFYLLCAYAVSLCSYPGCPRFPCGKYAFLCAEVLNNPKHV